MMIRRAEERDIPVILQLLEQVNMVHHRARPDLFNGPATKYNAGQLADIFRDDTRPVFVAVDTEDGQERVLGHCFCVYEIQEETPLRTAIRTLYIDDISVDEKCRGRKVGTALYDHAVETARRTGCYNITLHVWEGNDTARKFYDNLGMKVQFTSMETIL